MADETRANLMEQIKDQGEVVRKLKTTKADSTKGLPDSINLNSELAELNEEFADVSYVCGWCPTSKDVELFTICKNYPHSKLSNLPHLKRWFDNIKSYSDTERMDFPLLDFTTPLVEKVDRLTYCGNNDSLKNIDKKVRQLLHACKAATD